MQEAGTNTIETASPEQTRKKLPAEKHFLAAFFLSFSWGVLGVDRMYLGKWFTGILKLVTAGGFGLWIVIDLYLIMSGSMRDKWGRKLLQQDEYKKFAYRFVLIFAIFMGIIILVNGIMLIFSVMQLVDAYSQGGTLTLPEWLTNLVPNYSSSDAIY